MIDIKWAPAYGGYFLFSYLDQDSQDSTINGTPYRASRMWCSLSLGVLVWTKGWFNVLEKCSRHDKIKVVQEDIT